MPPELQLDNFQIFLKTPPEKQNKLLELENVKYSKWKYWETVYDWSTASTIAAMKM